jgi:hypothetical protein
MKNSMIEKPTDVADLRVLCADWPDDDDGGLLRPAAMSDLVTPSGRRLYHDRFALEETE